MNSVAYIKTVDDGVKVYFLNDDPCSVLVEDATLDDIRLEEVI